MAKFSYTAINKEGKTIQGTTEAANRDSLVALLARQGARPLVVKVDKSGPALSSRLKHGKKIKPKDLVVFTRQLSTMVSAGVPLVRSLVTLQKQTENPALQKHIADIAKELEGGMSLGDALQKHPAVFSPIYVNMVRAGEAAGILDEILKKLATQQEKDARIRGKFKSALTYPVILLSITMMVFMVLMVFVMPRIGKIIQDLAGPEAELPQLTKVMLGISSFMTSKWYVLIGVLVIGGGLLRRYIKTPKGRRKKDQLLLRIPVIKTIVKKVAIARFARIFASLMSAGVSVVESIEVTAKAIGNSVLEDELLAASKAVINGQQLSVPLGESKVFPPIVSQMMAIGEETGETDQILIKVADFYEEEVDATVDALSSILEPIMIVVMGTMVGLIAASVIGPISNLSNQI